MEHVHALLPAILLLLVCIVAIALSRPLRLSPIVGYLAAGVLIGPSGLGVIEQDDTTKLLAELGVVFLLFDIGLHFSLRHIWEARRDILGFGPLQVILCGAGLAAVLLLWRVDTNVAVLLGVTLALSSTAVVAETIKERGQQSCPVGVSATAVLIFQDICAIFLLIFAASLGQGDVALGPAIGAAVLKAAAAFAAAIVIGRYLIGPAFRFLAKSKNEEVFTVTALLIVLVTASATGMLGLSLTLGAFLGGMIISETPYRHVIQTEVKPFRGLLLAFFFITVGMTLNPAILLENWALILAAVAVLVISKVILTFLAALAVRVALPIALQTGFLLAQGSEFAFVVLATPGIQAAAGAELSAIILTTVAASLALTPLVSQIGQHLTRLIGEQICGTAASAVPSGGPTSAPIVVFGMNAIGRRVADGLEALGIPYTAFEMDHERFVSANTDGYPVAFGDAGDPRMLETFDMAQRPAIVIALPRYEVSQGLTPIVRERYPNAARFVSVANDEEKARFDALGMQAIVNRSVPDGLDLAAAVLKHQGAPDEKVEGWMQRLQEETLASGAR
jgi:CPA2 family monovalent cation:H+ antiporter-2